ncbi:MAG: HAD-IA family hydrolase [Betaproteobacteria bacterium]|nr:HAD-IA family hydrolase [Betaproteobacteria bacterium]
MPDAVLFDLDGTLADTAPDLGAALNALLAEEGQEALPIAFLRPFVSQGVRGLLRAGFALEPAAAGYERLSVRFLELYESRLCRETRLFTGIAEVLAGLEASGIAWGIVTNKRMRYTDPLVAQLDLYPRTTCVVSGDTTPAAKPSPLPLLHACDLLGCLPARTLYVGDDIRDIQAGKAAGCTTVAAAWGYLGDSGPVSSWNADAIVAHPAELLGLLGDLC